MIHEEEEEEQTAPPSKTESLNITDFHFLQVPI
jgi:hypothetical protein